MPAPLLKVPYIFDGANWKAKGRATVNVSVPTADVYIQPGDNIASKLNALPAGDIAYIYPGQYRMDAAWVPKAGQTVLGSAGSAVIDGAQVVTGWVSDGNGRWYVSRTFLPRDSKMHSATYSVCDTSAVDGTNLCWDRDTFWVDGVRSKRVASLAAGDAATGDRYFTDRGTNRIYIWTNPGTRLHEIDVTPYFTQSASASGVTLDGITIQRFAPPVQRGMLDIAGHNWTVKNCVIQNSHALGMFTSQVTGLTVQDTQFLYNGALGLGMGTASSGQTYSNNVIERCLFEGNNTEDFYIGDWEAGGFKTTAHSGGIVRNCTFRSNKGLDLWVDFGRRWLFENNTSDRAGAQAIRIECGQYCVVRGNTITNSMQNIGDHYRATHSNWYTIYDTCSISISESSYVECYGNTVAGTGNTNGILILVRGRTTTHPTSPGPSVEGTDHVWVHDNNITMTQAPVFATSAQNSTTGNGIAAGMGYLFTTGRGMLAASGYFGVAETWTFPTIGPWTGSGLSASQRQQVSGNAYTLNNAGTTPRFAWVNDAGTGIAYRTKNSYATKNPTDTTNVTITP
jgi:hypothetical protein